MQTHSIWLAMLYVNLPQPKTGCYYDTKSQHLIKQKVKKFGVKNISENIQQLKLQNRVQNVP